VPPSNPSPTPTTSRCRRGLRRYPSPGAGTGDPIIEPPNASARAGANARDARDPARETLSVLQPLAAADRDRWRRRDGPVGQLPAQPRPCADRRAPVRNRSLVRVRWGKRARSRASKTSANRPMQAFRCIAHSVGERNTTGSVDRGDKCPYTRACAGCGTRRRPRQTSRRTVSPLPKRRRFSRMIGLSHARTRTALASSVL